MKLNLCCVILSYDIVAQNYVNKYVLTLDQFNASRSFIRIRALTSSV